MKHRQLGRTGLKVSEIGFGAWAIGGTSYGPTRDEESLEALETAWKCGVNFYDTADTYGHGHSEELIAQFLKGKPKEKIIVATKAGWDFYHGGSKKNFDPEYIRFACEESLKRLGVESLDLYQLHNPNLELILRGDTVGILEKLKRAGKIRFIGISVHKEEEALAALEDSRIDTLQIAFNLIDQKMAERVFPKAKEKNIGVIVREPLACGLLTGKYKPDQTFVKTDHRNRWTKEKLELELQKIEKLKSILATTRLTITRAALEYVLDFDSVSCVIPGAKSKAQVLENVEASKNPLLRIEESYHLRELYHREDLFKKEMP
jgi:aryl-alcohol dehydrogenase-like predicted oxidoreductase